MTNWAFFKVSQYVTALALFLGRGATRSHIFPQLLDLQFQLFVLPHLPLEKVVGHPALFLNAHGGQAVEISDFIAGFLEILYLDKTLPDQGVDEEVHLAEADPQPGGEFPLGQLG